MIGIYKIENLIDGSIYIGQSKCISERRRNHNFKEENDLLNEAIEKYGYNNFSFDILEYCSEEELYSRERFWIEKYHSCILDTEYKKGYNKNFGHSKFHSKDVEKMVQMWNSGLTIKEISGYFNCKRNSIVNYLKKYSNYTIEESKKRSCEKYDGRSVNMYNKEGEFLQTFNSLVNAGKYCNVNSDTIIFSAQGKHILVKNKYFFIYTNEFSQELVQERLKKIKEYQKKGCKKVAQIDKNTNEIIAIYPSIKEAYAKLKIQYNGAVSACCKGNKNLAYGYKWRYIDD